MNKTIVFLFILLALTVEMSAQTSAKLTGQIIGTKNYYDYSNNLCTALTNLPTQLSMET